jgi:hypothetical protein
VHRLAEKVPDVVYADGGALFATEPRPDDEPQYDFGPGEHEVVEAGIATSAPRSTTRVPLGMAFNSEAFDFPDIDALSVCTLGLDRLILVSSDGVWSAERLDDLDVSAEVVEAAVECDRDGATAWVELDNSGGRYTAYGSGEVAVLQRGARLELSPGSGGAGLRRRPRR